MWFKNLIIYHLSTKFTFSLDKLEQQLATFAYCPCGSQDLMKIGWTPPIMGDYSNKLIHVVNNQILICAKKEEKILPSRVIKQELHNKIKNLESTTTKAKKINQKEKNHLKEEIINMLLPRAFSTISNTYIWINMDNNLIIVDAATNKRAEDNLSFLRKTIGSLPVQPFTYQIPIENTLTEWVRSGKPAHGLCLLDEAELRAPIESDGDCSMIHCKKQDLLGDEITAHITAKKRVTKLALEWEERIKFIITNDGKIKRLKFSNILKEQCRNNAITINKTDFYQRFNSDYILMSSEINALIKFLMTALGIYKITK